jgi:Fur family transcriptional regulator, zinc uptake regulator
MKPANPHSHGSAKTPCRPEDTGAFLREAELQVQRKNQKLTKVRRKVLTLLVESAAPAKAYDLLAALDGEGAAKPPTIYRALDFLQEMGLAHKIESLNAYVACGHASHKHAAVFMICTHCHGAEELHAEATDAALKHETRAAGFVTERAVIEVRGLCRNCQPA